MSFLFFVVVHFVQPAFSQKSQEIDKEVVVTASEVKISDDIQTSPEKVSISNPSSSTGLVDSLRKLPGAMVTNFSGPGTQSGIISPIATGSGGTLVSVDDVPVPAPFGRGNDLVFYPGPFFEKLDWCSPFYPWVEGLTSPGG